MPGSTRPRIISGAASKGVDAERVTPNGQFLAAGDAAGRLYFWAFSMYKIVEFFPAHPARAIRAVAVSPDGRRAAAGGSGGAIYIADVTRIGINVAASALRLAC